MNRVAGNNYGSCLLIKAISHVTQVLICRHNLLNGRNSEALLSVNVLVGRLELHVNFFLCLKVLSATDIEVDSEGLVAVNTAQIPLVCLANTNLGR